MKFSSPRKQSLLGELVGALAARPSRPSSALSSWAGIRMQPLSAAPAAAGRI